MQCFAITALISVLWMVYGYSLAFDTTGMVEGEINYPCRGWDEQGLDRKFRWMVRHVLDETTMERVLDAVWQVDHLPRVSVLIELVSSCRRPA